MEKLFVSFAVAATVGCAAASAHAQCSFDGPSKAKGMTTSFVRTHAGCPAGTFPIPNSQTGTGVPTCSPPYAYSSYEFAARGSGCTLKTSTKLESPCSFNGTGDCLNMKVRAACKGVLGPDDMPANGGGMAPSRISECHVG